MLTRHTQPCTISQIDTVPSLILGRNFTPRVYSASLLLSHTAGQGRELSQESGPDPAARMTALKGEVGQRQEMIRVLKTGQAPSAAKATRDILDPGRRPALPCPALHGCAASFPSRGACV